MWLSSRALLVRSRIHVLVEWRLREEKIVKVITIRIFRLPMAVETTVVRQRLVPSTRLLLALLVSFGFVVQYAQRTNLSMAIVCMVNRTGLRSLSEAKTSAITDERNRTVNRPSLFFGEKQFLWNEWDQQIILGSYWIGYLFTLIPSKNEFRCEKD